MDLTTSLELRSHKSSLCRAAAMGLCLAGQLLLTGVTARATPASLAPQTQPDGVEQQTVPAEDEATPHAGEILLGGWIQKADVKAGRLLIVVNAFELPNGRFATLPAPKTKIAVLDKQTVLRSTVAETVQAIPFDTWLMRRTVRVIGPDAGSGQPIVVRLALFGGQATPATQMPIVQAPVVQAPRIPVLQTLPPQMPVWTAPVKRPDSGYFGGVKEWVAASGLRVGAKFGVQDIGGRAERPGNSTSDHPRGLALDYMVFHDAAKGNALADYFVRNAEKENVKYVIWKDHIWQGGTPIAWPALPVDYKGNFTERHMDHVHVSYRDAPDGSGPWLSRGQVLASRGGNRYRSSSSRLRTHRRRTKR